MERKHYVWAVVALFPVLLVLLFATFRPILVLPRIKLAPGFAFTDQRGERLTNEDLRGKIVLYTFTYTHCEHDCPQDLTLVPAIQDRIAQLEVDIPVEFVTMAFDTGRDTPEQLAAYAAEVEADPAQWHIVTGEPKQLKQVIGNGFTTYYAPRVGKTAPRIGNTAPRVGEQEDGGFDLDPAFILVDGWGIMRAEYRTAEPEVDLIMRDIDLIATEARNSKGATRYAYEAAHLFVCYPR